MMGGEEGEEETHKETAESPRSTRSSTILKTKPLPNKKRSKMEMMTDDEEAATSSEPNNKEGQEYSQHEPDALEKAIADMMDQDDQQTTKPKHQSQKQQTSQETTSAGTEKPEPRTKRINDDVDDEDDKIWAEPDETRKIDTGAPGNMNKETAKTSAR